MNTLPAAASMRARRGHDLAEHRLPARAHRQQLRAQSGAHDEDEKQRRHHRRRE